MKKSYLLNLVIIMLFAGISCSPKLQKLDAPSTSVKKVAENPAQVQQMPPHSYTVEQSVDPYMDQNISIDPDFRIGTLTNGMKYYIRKNSKPENRVELRLAVNAGSIDEDDDQRGLAHFIEHMQFNGTKNFSKNELINYLESVGTKFGADLNAYTSFDETVYKLQVRTDVMGQLDTGLLVMYDWAGHATFDPEEIDKERGVVISEWRTRLSPQQRMMQEYLPTIYKDSKYSKRLPIGEPEIVQNADYETIKRFYKDWYRPDLMALVVVGDIDVDKMETQVVDLFSTIENPANERKTEEYYVPHIDNTTIKVVSDHEAPFSNVRIMNKLPHKPLIKKSDLLEDVERDLFNMMLQARLDEIRIKADPPFTYAYSGYSFDLGDIDAYSSFAMVPENKIIEAIKTLSRENERVKKYGFKKAELERQLTNMLKNAEEKVNEKDKTESAAYSNKAVYNYLDNMPIMSAEQYYNFLKINKSKINLATINNFAKDWIKEDNKVIIVTGPQREDFYLPDEELIIDALEEVKAEKIEDYVDNAVIEPLFSKNLQISRVMSTENFDEFGIRKIVLANGIEVYYKKTDFKNDEIQFSAYAPGGTSLFETDDLNNARFSSMAIREMGISEFDNSQLEKLLTGKNVRVNNGMSTLYLHSGGNSTVNDLETMFQLINLKFQNPRKDADAFSSFVVRNKGLYGNLLKNPDYYFMDLTSRVNYGENPRVSGFPKAEDFDKLSIDRVYDIYRESFADAGKFKFFFVGNFGENKLIEYCTKYLGNLPSAKTHSNWMDRNVNYLPGKIDKVVFYGEAPKTYINIVYHGDFDYNTKSRYEFYSMIDGLRIKLRESLREDLGGVYGVRVSGNVDKEPKPEYSITISFNSDPPKTDTLINAAMEVISKVQKEGLDAETLKKVKETQRQEKIKNLKENEYWLDAMERIVKEGGDFSETKLEATDAKINALSNDDIKNAAIKYFNENNKIQLQMYPENFKK